MISYHLTITCLQVPYSLISPKHLIWLIIIFFQISCMLLAFHPVLCFFKSFLHHRCQCVSFQGSQSDFKVVEKGVPQGSSLGSLLFSIYFNDLTQVCSNTQILLYADDTVLYSSNCNITQLQHTLQSDFNLMQIRFSLLQILQYAVLLQTQFLATVC